MPIENPDVIDFSAHNPSTNEVSLVMVETRDWRKAPEALPQLQVKFRAYADYLLSGSLSRQQPELAKCPLRIDLYHYSPLTEPVAGVLRHWAGKLAAVPVAVYSRRMYWNPVVNFFRTLAARFAGPQRQGVRWAPEPGTSEPLLTPAQFLQEVVAALRRKMPTLQVQITGDLEIKLTNAAGKEVQGFLDNAYNHYKAAPETKADLLQKYVASFLEIPSAQEQSIDPTRIVPVLKDQLWMAELNEGLAARGGQTLEPVYEMYNEELIIAYAVDSPTSIRYLSAADLGQLPLKTSGDLRKLACANLERLLPTPDLQKEGGLYRIKAGGDYDASLLLLESLWTSGKIPVAGELVAAVPARDFLVVTGSGEAGGVNKLKTLAQTVAAQAPYRLSPTLFVYRQGQFIPYES